MKRIIAVLLAVSMLFVLAACAGKNEKPTEESKTVRMGVLTGPTGVGASALMASAAAKTTELTYDFTVAAANDEITAALINGTLDIAAVATNLAATLYQKTQGGVQLLALNTLGVLYILENGDTVHGIADLKGKRIIAPGQGANPEYVLEYILTRNGLTYSTDGTDADVRIEFMAADAITAAMATGSETLCMLPEPAVTALTVKNADVRVAVDMTEAWNALGTGGQLTMGCLVVRTEFAKANPNTVKTFLKEYAASVSAVTADPATAGGYCETYGIVAKAAIATKAIPHCSLVCISGAEVRTVIEPYYQVLFEAKAASIGGKMPDDAFYYVP